MNDKFMLSALALSRKALPDCLPNPPIGCIIVDTDVIVAEGFTRSPGHFHAEVDALRQIGNKTFDCLKMYVTLEPCSFYGRTPSCALAIAKDPRIREIYVSLVDPDPRNQGKGLDILRHAGKVVDVGLCSEQVSFFLDRYLLK